MNIYQENQSPSASVALPPDFNQPSNSPVSSKLDGIDITSRNPGLGKISRTVTNAEFVAGIFGSPADGASSAVRAKNSDPTHGGWPAIQARLVVEKLTSRTNNYINTSTFFPGQDGSFRACKDNFSSCHFILLDDIGSKVSPEHLNNFEVSWLLETSPGNFQAGIILDPPLTDPGQAAQLLSDVISARLCDSSSTGAITRWARLPVGINGKEKYRDQSGEPFQCRLVKWSPTKRYTVADVYHGLRLQHLPPLRYLSEEEFEFDTPLPEQSWSLNACRSAVELEPIAELLNSIDPDSDYGDWIKVLMAVNYESGGSDAGLEIVDKWSSRGKKYHGRNDVESRWQSLDGCVKRPLTIGTLKRMTREFGFSFGEEIFDIEDFVAADAEPNPLPSMAMNKPPDCRSVQQPFKN